MGNTVGAVLSAIIPNGASTSTSTPTANGTVTVTVEKKNDVIVPSVSVK
jgi:hypothetical protein